MEKKQYKLRFLPLFLDDFEEIINYITYVLKNPTAANNLINLVEKAMNDRLPFAESFDIYPSKYEHKYNYYCINVNNYSIFYVIIDDVMEVRRIIYSKRNIKELI